MSDEDITLLIQRIQTGRDEEATQHLWNSYYLRLVQVSRRYLGDLPKRVADEEDVALCALNSFFRAAETGKLPDLQNRDELWRVLLTITIRKANRHKERAMAQKRGGGMARGESGFVQGKNGGPDELAGVPDERVVSDVAAECRDLIDLLADETLKRISIQRLRGYTVEEIAAELGVAVSTIKRKIRRIREIWSHNDCG